MTLDKKILTGFIACSVVLLAVAIISFRNSEELSNTNKWVVHTNEVLYKLEQVYALAVEVETTERGFIITGDESYLENYNVAKNRIEQDIDAADGLTKDK